MIPSLQLKFLCRRVDVNDFVMRPDPTPTLQSLSRSVNYSQAADSEISLHGRKSHQLRFVL